MSSFGLVAQFEMKRHYNEKLVEDFIKEHPQEFLGEDLRFVARQMTLDGFRPDLIFADGNDDRVVVEVQLDALDRNHFYKILEYRDLLLERDNTKKVRTLLFCNELPPRYVKLLKTHGVRAVVMARKEFLTRARQLNPSLVIVDPQPTRTKPVITTKNILAQLAAPLELPMSDALVDAIVFWERSWSESRDDNYWFNVDLERSTSGDENSGAVHLPSPLCVPAETVVSSNVLRLGKQRWRTLNTLLDLLIRRYDRNTPDCEIILGWRHQVDVYGYELYISGSIRSFMGLCDTYRIGQSDGCDQGKSYNLDKIASDLSEFAQIKIYEGRYPNYKAVTMFEGFEVAKGPGSLEEIPSPREKEWFQENGFNSRAECYAASLFGEHKWATVRLLKVNQNFLSSMRVFLSHMWHHSVFWRDRLDLNEKCVKCLTFPKLLKNVNPHGLELSARYFQH